MTHIDELQVLIDKWRAEEKTEEKPGIEPCPICGGEMKEDNGYIFHVGGPCGYLGGIPIEGHNIIARVLREAVVGLLHGGNYESHLKAIRDFEALRTKAREEMKWATSNIKEAKEGM